MSTARATRRRMQRRLEKLDRKQRDVAKELMEAQAQESLANAKVLDEKVKANELLKIAREKMSADLKDAYDKQLMNMKAQMEKEANQQIKHYSREVEQKIQSEYRKKFKTIEEDVKATIIGEMLTMTAKVLIDNLNHNTAEVELYVTKLMELADDLQHDEPYNDGVPEDKQFNIVNITKELDAEGFNLTELLVRVDEKLERDKLYRSFPYVFEHKGWTAEDDSILEGMIMKDFDYLTIAKKLVKTEGAVKTRAYKLWKTSVAESIKKIIQKKKAAA